LSRLNVSFAMCDPLSNSTLLRLNAGPELWSP
jgi:hypothetical protein